MELIGFLDSPYVRRVAIAFQLLDIEFKHRSMSVFSGYDEFRAVNPVVKAPSLVCDNGTLLMDSTLIIDYGMALSKSTRCLMPNDIHHRQKALELTSIALVACEKSVQIYYEKRLRPVEKQHPPWILRVTEQLHSALELLESFIHQEAVNIDRGSINLAEVTACVTWKFIREMIPDVVNVDDYAALNRVSQMAELLPEFQRAPFGELIYPVMV